MDSGNYSYMFAPLETVDAKSLTDLAEKMKKSLSKTDKAVGAFLLRYVDSKGGAGKGGASSSPSAPHDLSKLRNLR